MNGRQLRCGRGLRNVTQGKTVTRQSGRGKERSHGARQCSDRMGRAIEGHMGPEWSQGMRQSSDRVVGAREGHVMHAVAISGWASSTT